jgi:hypothetical protein
MRLSGKGVKVDMLLGVVGSLRFDIIAGLCGVVECTVGMSKKAVGSADGASKDVIESDSKVVEESGTTISATLRHSASSRSSLSFASVPSMIAAPASREAKIRVLILGTSRVSGRFSRSFSISRIVSSSSVIGSLETGRNTLGGCVTPDLNIPQSTSFGCSEDAVVPSMDSREAKHSRQNSRPQSVQINEVEKTDVRQRSIRHQLLASSRGSDNT